MKKKKKKLARALLVFLGVVCLFVCLFAHGGLRHGVCGLGGVVPRHSL